MDELKPCPFCGETPQIYHRFHALDDSLMWRVECLNLDCEINPVTAYHEDNISAWHAWNFRTIPERESSDQAFIEALTPSGATKAAYLGEFKYGVERFDENGDAYPVEYTVPWTTIKEIMAAILRRAKFPLNRAISTTDIEDGATKCPK